VNIVDLLVRQAESRPDATAIVDARHRITFKQLEDESARYAASLRAAGLEPGETALVVCPMSIRLYVTVLGLLRLGLVAMFADPSAGSAHVDRCCRRVRPRAFLGTGRAQVLRLLSRAVREIPIHRAVAGRGRGPAFEVPVERSGATHPAVVTFTTGSTGMPKAAVRTHGFLLAQHRAVTAALGLAPGDVDLTTLPLFVLANLGSGVTSVIPDADLRYPGTVNPQPILQQIRRHRATRTVASPALLDRIAWAALGDGMPLDSLTHVFTGGGPVFPGVMDRLASVAPHGRLVAVYGSTEAEPIATLDWSEVSAQDRVAIGRGGGLLAGRQVSSIGLAILPDRWGEPIGSLSQDQFARDSLPAGQPGEIVVSGEHVLAGYLGGVGDGENKFTVGETRWHRTGDAGYLDACGRLWLMGRSAAALDDRRGRVYPFAIEAAAHECAGVERAALVGSNERRILAVQVSDRESDGVREGLAHALNWASIDEVRIVPVIPVDPRHNAKVDYERLRAVVERQPRARGGARRLRAPGTAAATSRTS